jgi:hypothetical protein
VIDSLPARILPESGRVAVAPDAIVTGERFTVDEGRLEA